MIRPMKQPAAVRRRRIVELVGQGEYLRPADIAAQMSVSGETVRRDLMALERSGELKRIHGGAMAPVRLVDTEPDRAIRSTEHRAEKEEIATVVASMISDTDTIFLDVGTTVETVAMALPGTFHGIVVTNSLSVGSILGGRPGIELYVLGGRVRTGEMTTYGPEVLAQVRSFNANWAFLGAGGVDVAAGFTDYASEDVPTKQLMIQQSAKAYALAVGEKLGRTAFRHVCGLDKLSGIITDSKTSRIDIEALREAGIEVLQPESKARASWRVDVEPAARNHKT
jgi:DeoR/GlpR family transcriptional regulator of sugar metabolism